MRVLVLGGPPAVGKSTIGRMIAGSRPACAFIDVDDVRQLLITGAAAPWEGREGRMQQLLGVTNACALAVNFVRYGTDVVIVDVLSDETVAAYRKLLDNPLLVQLQVDYQEALRRAATRPTYLTGDEFGMLHEQQASFSGADITLDTTTMAATDTTGWLSTKWD